MSTHGIEYFPEVDNCLRFLEPSILEMFQIMDRYINKRTKNNRWQDLPYYRNERATLSVLAGGIWRSNEDNFVLEEASGKKKIQLEEASREKKIPRPTYWGRQDIWFMAEGIQCYGEAKQKALCFWNNAPRVASKLIDTLRREAAAAAHSKNP